MLKPPEKETPEYITDESGNQFFVYGNTKIKVTEHFNKNGRSIGALIEKAVEYAATAA